MQRQGEEASRLLQSEASQVVAAFSAPPVHSTRVEHSADSQLRCPLLGTGERAATERTPWPERWSSPETTNRTRSGTPNGVPFGAARRFALCSRSSAHRRPRGGSSSELCAASKIGSGGGSGRGVLLDAQCVGRGELSVFQISEKRFSLPTGYFWGLISFVSILPSCGRVPQTACDNNALWLNQILSNCRTSSNRRNPRCSSSTSSSFVTR